MTGGAGFLKRGLENLEERVEDVNDEREVVMLGGVELNSQISDDWLSGAEGTGWRLRRWTMKSLLKLFLDLSLSL